MVFFDVPNNINCEQKGAPQKIVPSPQHLICTGRFANASRFVVLAEYFYILFKRSCGGCKYYKKKLF